MAQKSMPFLHSPPQPASPKQEITKADKEIDTLVKRIMKSDNERVIAAYEDRIDELEKKKLGMAEKSTQKPPKKETFQEKLEPALLLLANPYKLWALGSLEVKRIVLKLALTGPVYYNRNEPPRTALKPLQDGGFMPLFGGGVKDGGPEFKKVKPELLEKLSDYSLQIKPLSHEIMAILDGGAE